MKKGIRIKAGFLLLLASVFVLGIGGAQAEDYPKSTVQFVIPYSPGGLTDIFYRTISDGLAKNIGGHIAMINKRGGGGMIGTSYVVNTKPDGYTLVNISAETVSIAPAFTPDMPYDPAKDLTYIAKTAVVAVGVTVRAESPFKTFEDLLSFAKANPGKLTVGGMGIVGTPHMIYGVFTRDAKVDLKYIPFDGGGQVVANLLGGHTDLAFTSISSVAMHLASGKARLLAVCSPRRLEHYPDVPTVAEKGYPKSSFAVMLGVGGPAGLPPAVVSKWEAAIEKTLKDPAVLNAIDKTKGVVVDFKSGADYYKELMANAGIYREIAASMPKK